MAPLPAAMRSGAQAPGRWDGPVDGHVVGHQPLAGLARQEALLQVCAATARRVAALQGDVETPGHDEVGEGDEDQR